MTQNEALDILKTGANIFLTGEPGSGKTYTVNTYIGWLRAQSVEPSITASTGIAATHIGGYTIHSWCGIGIKTELTERDLDRIKTNRRVLGRIRNAKVLIIDEVSMLSANTLTMVEVVCRKLRQSPLPFGGLQVVLVGDFFQLPPIIPHRIDTDGQKMLEIESTNFSLFAFASPAWRALNLSICYLAEQHRQEDAEFLGVLSAIRHGEVSETHRSILKSRHAPHAPENTHSQRFSHNADVDRINAAKLAKLPSSHVAFTMKSSGPAKLAEHLAKGCLSPETLLLKTGARVMFTKNDPARAFVNGTIGTVTKFDATMGFPVIKTARGYEITAEPMDWTIEDNGRTLARISQIPLRLAWAITVHKSQGMSLDSAYMDLSDTFEYGQGYVAISRVRTLKGLSLAGINERTFETHPDIRGKDREFRAASENTASKFAAIPATELIAIQQHFIKACGGTTSRAPADERARHKRSHRPEKSKERRWQSTANLVREGRTIEETARLRGRTIDTILEHLENLRELGKMQAKDIAHLFWGKEKEVEEIYDAFRALGTERLKPVFRRLDGRISYETIRLARLLFDK